jgi:hypothetical protein
MLPLKTLRLISTCIIGAMWLGAVVFTATYVLPMVEENIILYQEISKTGDDLSAKLKGETPSKGLIEQYRQLKAKYIEEQKTCAYFYIQHNEKLDRKLLKSFMMDPIQLQANYLKEKARMADKAGNPNFVPTYPWEKPGGQPPIADFPRIEKRTCIADVLVDMLTSERGTIIQLLDIGEPTEPVGVPPALLDTGGDIVRFRIIPVTAAFTTKFAGLGRMLDLFVANPTGSGRGSNPCMVVRSIQVERNESTDATGAVSVKLGIDVYDFYKVESKTASTQET